MVLKCKPEGVEATSSKLISTKTRYMSGRWRHHATPKARGTGEEPGGRSEVVKACERCETRRSLSHPVQLLLRRREPTVPR